MASLIRVKAFTNPAYKPYSPSLDIAIAAGTIITVQPATASQISAYPLVNSQIFVSTPDANSFNNGAYLVVETVAAIVALS